MDTSIPPENPQIVAGEYHGLLWEQQILLDLYEDTWLFAVVGLALGASWLIIRALARRRRRPHRPT